MNFAEKQCSITLSLFAVSIKYMLLSHMLLVHVVLVYEAATWYGP